MADKKISQLTALSAANVASATDVLAIVDTSATETKKITAKDLIDGALNGGTANGVLYLNGSKVATSGTALTFDGTNLGIGTTSPAAKLDVSTGIRVNSSGTVTSGFANAVNIGTWDALGYDSGGTDVVLGGYRTSQFTGIRFYGGGSERMRLDSSGNLGLGVTPSAWAGKALQIGNASNSGWASIGYDANGKGFFSTSAYNNTGSSWTYTATGFAATLYSADAGAHAWYTAPSGTAGNAISFTQAMTLSAAGGLTVGSTSDPGAGKILAEGSSASHYVASSKAGITTTYLITDASGANVQVDGAWPIRFTTNSTERARITSGGDFLTAGKTTASFTTVGAELLANGQINTASANLDNLNIYNTTAAAYRFYVSSGGTVFATNTTISAISDQRLKENVRDLDVGLDAIMALKPRKFDWKEGKGQDKKDVRGFIAQEFEQVFPDLIDEWKDPAPEGEEPYKSVRQDLIPVLVKAIQELSAKVAALEAK
jgi:hypothetical protein